MMQLGWSGWYGDRIMLHCTACESAMLLSVEGKIPAVVGQDFHAPFNFCGSLAGVSRLRPCLTSLFHCAVLICQHHMLCEQW